MKYFKLTPSSVQVKRCRPTYGIASLASKLFMAGRVLYAKSRSILTVGVGVVTLIFVFTTGSAYAVTVDSGDWTAPTPGVDLGFIYQQYASRSDLYVNGNKTLSNADLNSYVTILRYTHPISIGGFVVNPQFLLPFGTLKAEGNMAALGKTSGFGDLILAAPIWLVNKPKEHTYLSIAPYLFLPTGSYDKNRPLNLGENRWKGDLQVGAMIGLGKKFSTELTGDVMWYGNNTKFGSASATLKQDQSFQVQAYLNWYYTPTTTLAIGSSWTSGGTQSVDSLSQNNPIGTTSAILTASTWVDKHTQLMFSFGRDLSVRNGFKEDTRFNIRLLRAFF